MDCSEAKPQLTALVSGRVSPDDEAELRAHLEMCEACSLEVELFQGRSAPSPVAPGPEPEPLLDVAPLAPPHSDWTVEKIFSDGGASSAAPLGAAVSAPAEPGAHPSLLFAAEDPTAIPGIPAEPVPLMPNSTAKPPPEAWDFEPADAARDATPPEESLLFAEQALNRRIDDPSRKGAAIRAILWGGSAVAGVALLGVSLWMAMAVPQAPLREIAASVKNSAALTSEAKPVGELSEKSVAPPSASSATNPETGVPAASAPPAPTLPASSTAAPVPIKSSFAPKSLPAAPPSAPTGAKASAPKPALPPISKRGDGTAPAAVVRSGATSVATKEPQPAARAKQDDDDMWPTDDPVHATPAAPKSATPSKQAAAAAPETQGHVPAPQPATPAAPQPATPAVPETPRVDLKPIDRIHAATDQAAKDQDLLALRQLKTTWKHLLRTVVGPDRSRAKRELADCLWAIQTLSGRDAEQRETLLAYRDYLLSAPAGGADARSAARLRELEDAISERR